MHNMDNTAKTATGHVGFLGLLFLVFLVLKLCGVIDWSWLWVTAPLWTPFAIVLVIVALIVLYQIVATVIKRILGK